MSLLAAALVTAGMILFFLKSRHNFLALPELPAIESDDLLEDVIIIIPARNEEDNIARAISSFPRDRVVVVDDESSDRTAAIARENGATVLPSPQLSGEQKGKPMACAAGAQATASEWILFVDADTWYAPRFLSSLVVYAATEELDAVSVFPRQITGSLFEKILLPYAFALYFCGVDSRRINDPRSPHALANGQCLLFQRGFYDFIGGHSAVATSVIEDANLASLIKRHRGRIRVVRSDNLAFAHMYTGLREIWRGFTKNSFRFLLAEPGTGWQVVLASIFATSWLPALIWLIRDETWIAAALFALVPGAVLVPWYGLLAILFAPVGIYLFQLIALNGMFVVLAGRKVSWKGRRV